MSRDCTAGQPESVGLLGVAGTWASRQFMCLFLSCFLLWQPKSTECTEVCGEGQYLQVIDNSSTCEVCGQGLFMPLVSHVEMDCFACQRVQNTLVEFVASPCTTVKDAVILCRHGYYRKQKRECVRCTFCQFILKTCDMYYDSVCCLPGQLLAKKGSANLSKCHDTGGHTSCMPGQYLNSVARKCLACPPLTFISEQNHTRNKCQTCQNCSLHKEGNIYIARECSPSHDTVCYSQPNASLTDFAEGQLTNASTTTASNLPSGGPKCGENLYLYTAISPPVCRLCPPRTYMNEIKHNKTFCFKCGLQTGVLPPSASCLRHKYKSTRTETVSYEIITGYVLLACGCLLLVGLSIRSSREKFEEKTSKK